MQTTRFESTTKRARLNGYVSDNGFVVKQPSEDELEDELYAAGVESEEFDDNESETSEEFDDNESETSEDEAIVEALEKELEMEEEEKELENELVENVKESEDIEDSESEDDELDTDDDTDDEPMCYHCCH